MRALALILLSALLVASCAVAPAFGYLEHSSVRLENDGGHGSGVVIGKRLILTAKHVAKEDGLNAVTRDGDSLKATKVWESADQDIAIMRTDADFNDSVTVAKITCDEPKVGDSVSVIGNPISAKFAFAFGHISASLSQDDADKKVLMNMDVLPGDSGGPVFDAKGRVVGVAVSSMLAPVLLGGIGVIGRSFSAYSMMEPVGDLCRALPPEVAKL